jgi:hypothetical protein
MEISGDNSPKEPRLIYQAIALGGEILEVVSAGPVVWQISFVLVLGILMIAMFGFIASLIW